MKYDLLIENGTLVDPAQGIHDRRDVAFAGGVVAEVGADLPGGEARVVIDAEGRYVTPGWIDVHVHVFPDVTHYGIEPDPTCIARGATTVVDAGSAGADIFPGFRKYVIEAAQTRILAELNISSQGMITVKVGELSLLELADVDACRRMIEANRDLLIGVKARLTRNTIVGEAAGLEPLHRAREAADAVDLPIMIHPQAAWCDSLDDILAVMKKDDILTHCFHNSTCGILDDEDRIRPSVREAIERGVLLDVGHGSGSFSWPVVEAALEQGVPPHTISSDLHIYNLHGPVYDLANVMTKFLHLGLSLDDVIAMVTSVPAASVLRRNDLGTLAPGAIGDAVVAEMQEGSFELVDARGVARTGSRNLEPAAVVKDGRLYRQG